MSYSRSSVGSSSCGSGTPCSAGSWGAAGRCGRERRRGSKTGRRSTGPRRRLRVSEVQVGGVFVFFWRGGYPYLLVIVIMVTGDAWVLLSVETRAACLFFIDMCRHNKPFVLCVTPQGANTNNTRQAAQPLRPPTAPVAGGEVALYVMYTRITNSIARSYAFDRSVQGFPSLPPVRRPDP